MRATGRPLTERVTNPRALYHREKHRRERRQARVAKATAAIIAEARALLDAPAGKAARVGFLQVRPDGTPRSQPRKKAAC